MMRIKDSSFVISVTAVELVLKLLGQYSIYRVKKTELIPLSSATGLNLKDPESLELLSLLQGFLSSSNDILFSKEYDLTLSLQHQYTSKSSPQKPLERFLMNKKMLKEVPLPYIGGRNPFLIAIEGVALDGQLKHPGTPDHRSWLTLLCRRGIERVGTRFHSRGINEDGAVSNFVESEQIFQHYKDNQQHIYAHLQVRGSIPLFWDQNINIRYRPPFEIHSKGLKTSSSLKKHMASLKESYSEDIVLVNLVNKSGWEGELAAELEEQIKAIPFCHYKHFEFTKECPNMNYHNISKLMIYLDPFLKKESFFHYIPTRGGAGAGDDKIISLQKGIIRTNCIDCLDRTNLTQSWIARKVLYEQMKVENRASTKHTFLLKEDDFVFRSIWSTHGDLISRQYSGTGALKSDFTRTGKRTIVGLYNDGMNSIHRYFLNNFYDARKQDQYDLFYRDDFDYGTKSIPHWWIETPASKEPLLPLMLALLSLYLAWKACKKKSMTFLLSSMLCVILAYKWIIRRGQHFVRFPRLFPSKTAISVWREKNVKNVATATISKKDI